MKNKRSIKSLKKELDGIFSIYIRSKYSHNGMVQCYTCSTIKPIKEMQCGHYISRKVNILRYDERNARPQCYVCNCMRYGEQSLFGKLLDKEYDYNISDKLMEKRHEIHQFTTSELYNLIAFYKNKMLQLIAVKVLE